MMRGLQLAEKVVGDSEMILMGGSSSLYCPLASDIILTCLPVIGNNKVYEHVGILANILDNSVRAGILGDDIVAQIQGCLRHIFQQQIVNETKSTSAISAINISKVAPDAKKLYNPAEDKAFNTRLLQQVIGAAVTAMKNVDPQGLFLNPVTDAIAPGYSTIVKEPMCIKTIETKLATNRYAALGEYERDVRLMFQNCIDYNIGKEGAWFRGEARRQTKIWKTSILHQAREHLRKETVKRARDKNKQTDSKDAQDKKRKKDEQDAMNKKTKSTELAFGGLGGPKKKFKADDEAITRLTIAHIDPLPGTKSIKRKKDMDYPSMPALASMLLSDPFVVRLLIDKTLRCLRNDTLKQKSVPSLHPLIPSLLQLLYIAQCSAQLCAMRGKKFFVPDCGLTPPPTEEKEEEQRSTSDVPFASLRKYLPLLTATLLEVHVDHRTAVGGDLADAAPHLPQRPVPNGEDWEGTTRLCVLRALLQGALVHIIQPGSTNEVAFKSQCPRFVLLLEKCTAREQLVREGPFWMSLAVGLLRHKTKLPKGIRDIIFDVLELWLKNAPTDIALVSEGHRVTVWLLNEWYRMGNLIMPRDLLLKLVERVGCAAAHPSKDAFSEEWRLSEEGFKKIKGEYERMLKNVGEPYAGKWRETMDVVEAVKNQADGEVKQGESK
mmetsp:Transcript_54941/g.66171  ORF Transcript_54941/g.66171 Transcript_54941/m.66171 type:complete len:663 (+) Transcript_54941:28-2016(+)